MPGTSPPHLHAVVPHTEMDIDLAIVALLKSGPKTASMLYRLLNVGSGIPASHLRHNAWRRLWKIAVDKRTLKRHLRYLQRDGLIDARSQPKILVHNRTVTARLVTYYFLKPHALTPTPMSAQPSSLHPSPSSTTPSTARKECYGSSDGCATHNRKSRNPHHPQPDPSKPADQGPKPQPQPA